MAESILSKRWPWLVAASVVVAAYLAVTFVEIRWGDPRPVGTADDIAALSERDDVNADKVCLVSVELAQDLFGGEPPRDAALRLFELRFRVIGVFREGVESAAAVQRSEGSRLTALGPFQGFVCENLGPVLVTKCPVLLGKQLKQCPSVPVTEGVGFLDVFKLVEGEKMTFELRDDDGVVHDGAENLLVGICESVHNSGRACAGNRIP